MLWRLIQRLKVFSLLGALFLVFGLVGCAETELAVHTVKSIEKSAPPVTQGRYKVGKPYQIAGNWYYPKEDYEYVETGIASWYGPGFHGKPTANGETFDRYRISAAHRTLPLPSVVQVTNLENGRSLKVRVNDRGPFSKNRIIDLSERAAKLLGFKRQGTAKVRVEILPAESRRLEIFANRGEEEVAPAVPLESVAVESLESSGELANSNKVSPGTIQRAELPTPTPLDLDSKPKLTRERVRSSDIWIQVGAFARKYNAMRLKARLSSLAMAHVSEVKVGDATLFRVRLGPIDSVAETDRLVSILEVNDYDKVRIIVE